MTQQKCEIDYLTLKWGTLKDWSFHSDKAIKLLKEYDKIGSCMSAVLQKDTPRQKEIICELIYEGNFKKVYLAWEGKKVSKEQAKKYVLNYGRKEDV